MLSLPLIAPQNEYSFFLTPHLRPPTHNDTPSDNQNSLSNPQQQQQQQQRRQTHNTANPSAPTRTTLAQLLADEHAITARKHNIRRFGAGWIKPPGVTKTLQTETEERAEREEQEALARREQMMLDMQARQEAEEARARAAEGENEGADEEERDLDEDVPDADEEQEEEEEEEDDEDMTDSDEEEEEDDEEEEEEVEQSGIVPHADDTSFMVGEEESLLENSFLPVVNEDEQRQRLTQERYQHLQEAELTGIAQDEEDLGIERDLDDSVPEAGSYQHTDSELEVSSDEEEDEDEDEEEEQSGLEQQYQSELVGAVMQRSRSSLLSRDVSSLLDSSFVTSSPVGRLRSATHRTNQR